VAHGEECNGIGGSTCRRQERRDGWAFRR
jgi:hypothetical protein